MTLCIIASAIGLDALDINSDSSPFLGIHASGRYASGFYSPPDIAEIINYNRLLTWRESRGCKGLASSAGFIIMKPVFLTGACSIVQAS